MQLLAIFDPSGLAWGFWLRSQKKSRRGLIALLSDGGRFHRVCKAGGISVEMWKGRKQFRGIWACKGQTALPRVRRIWRGLFG